MKRTAYFAIGAVGVCGLLAQQLKLPNGKDSFHFAVLGDTGTGGTAQYQIGAKVVEYRKVFPFDVLIMLGDNMYGGQKARDYEKKFEEPYKLLLAGGVKFFAALGNHDDPSQKSYKLFNMGGERYFTFKPRPGIRFFALDSNYMDKPQLTWLEKELAASGSEWKIAFFHHPLYSSGGAHGSSMELRAILEPIFVKYGVNLVLAGHDHFYERLKPQQGIQHFVIGGSAKLREGNVRKSEITAASFDTDNSFALMEISGDTLHYQAISRTGRTIDAGSYTRPAAATTADRAK
jgi:3',5'-cyclic AMP phosphodiesterase CpdA